MPIVKAKKEEAADLAAEGGGGTLGADVELMLQALRGGAEVVLTPGGSAGVTVDEWLDHGAGLCLEKVLLVDVLVIPDNDRPYVGYVLQEDSEQVEEDDGEGGKRTRAKVYGLSEREGMKGLRLINLGSRVSIIYGDKHAIGRNRTKWDMEVRCSLLGTGPNVWETVQRKHRALKANVFRNLAPLPAEGL